MYSSYADYSDYISNGGNTLTANSAEYYLKQASRHIDSLTFNRITPIGIDKLTQFQRDIVKEVTCKLADFEYDNEEILKSVLSNYSINGVSMSFNESWNIKVEKGVAIPRDLHDLLKQTGLCSYSFRGW